MRTEKDKALVLSRLFCNSARKTAFYDQVELAAGVIYIYTYTLYYIILNVTVVAHGFNWHSFELFVGIDRPRI